MRRGTPEYEALESKVAGQIDDVIIVLEDVLDQLKLLRPHFMQGAVERAVHQLTGGLGDYDRKRRDEAREIRMAELLAKRNAIDGDPALTPRDREKAALIALTELGLYPPTKET
jgi:hypothetical protein